MTLEVLILVVLIAKLQAFDLIQEAGKKDAVGRPNLYATTDYFLDLWGLIV